MSPTTRFSWLFATQFFALGAAMPFVPVALENGGLSPELVGLVLAAGTTVRLIAGLVSARVAEMVGARTVLVVGSVIAGLTLPGLAFANGLFLLLMVQLVHGVAVAPIVPLSDAAAVAEIRRRPFDYGRVRAWGSVAFIVAAGTAGQAVAWAGPSAALLLAGGALLCTAAVASGVTASLAVSPMRTGNSLWAPFRVAGFSRLLLCSALIQGSHAMYYGFSALHWRGAGLSPGLIGLLWAWAVAAEVLLFFFGRRLADGLGPRGLAMLAGGCGVLRWSITGTTDELWALLLAQSLHAATFGAMHLAAIRAMATLPAELGAHAQSLHSALGVGFASGIIMLASGTLYAQYQGSAFMVMALVCALGLWAGVGLRFGRSGS